MKAVSADKHGMFAPRLFAEAMTCIHAKHYSNHIKTQ